VITDNTNSAHAVRANDHVCKNIMFDASTARNVLLELLTKMTIGQSKHIYIAPRRTCIQTCKLYTYWQIWQ